MEEITIKNDIEKNRDFVICVIPLYNPNQNEIENIDSYIERLDYCVLMDDSPENKKSICEELLAMHSGRIEYIWNGKNIGLCKSANNGIKRAIELGAKWILIMNPDSNMHNDIVAVYKSYIRTHNTNKVAILAPQYNYDRHKRSVKSGTRKIKYPNMSGSLINVSVINAIGDYDERFFIDGLDNEWCLRALRAGYDIIECSEALLDHHPAETRELRVFGKTVFRYGWDTAIRYYYQFRSLMMIHNMYHSIYNDMFFLYKILKMILLFDHKSDYMTALKMAKEDVKNGYYGKYER